MSEGVSNYEKNKRIAKNTLALYFRMLLLLVIGIYTSRVVLHALGETDLGVYTTVGGFVAMFAMLSNSMSAAISRYMTFEMGKDDKSRLPAIFSTAIIIQLLIALIIVILAEVIGPWYMDRYMTIPQERMCVAKIIFQFSVLTFAINLVSVPFNAAIIAHEKMTAFSMIGLFEGFCKLGTALLLTITTMDRLLFYGLAMCLVAVIVRLLYQIYCRMMFEECRAKFSYDHKLVKEMFGFAGWNFIGAGSVVLRDHGGTLIINMFYPPAVNAARALAVQVNGIVSQFASNFMTSINPQITKSYASGDRHYMMSLVNRGSRFSLFLMMFLSFPILFNTEYLLDLWQVTVPQHTVSFVRLVLMFTMIEGLSSPLITLMLATGDIKKYQIIVGGLQLLNIPISYIALKYGAPPEVVYVVAIVVSICCLLSRLILLRSMVGLDVPSFVKNVLLVSFMVALLAFPLPFILSISLPYGFWNMVVISLASVICTGVSIWFVGLRKDERQFFRSQIKEKLGV